MKLRKRLQTKTNNRLPIVIIVTSVVLATTYGLVAYSQSLWPFQPEATENIDSSKDTRPTNSIDYSPPTEEEIQSSQEGKKNSANNETGKDESPTSNEELSSTPVAVSFANVVGENVEVRAFIPQVIEGSGTCTAALTKGSLTVIESSKAFIDASSSQCEPILIPTSKFPQSGNWSLTVSYVSNTHKGTSEKLEVKLP